MKKKALIALTSAFSVFLIGTIGLSLAWFTTAKIVDTSGLNGSVLRSYFDIKEGKTADDTYGTEANPFVITRPKHWENLVKLQYAMDRFDTSNYYFEVGKIFSDGDGKSYQVYNYSDAGIADGTYSSILNLGGLATLPPLGSNEKPFRNHIKGNGLTISNFEVGGEGYGDIGIFGYIGEEILDTEGNVTSAAGTCENLYFDNFTIDVTKASHLVVKDQHPEHTHTKNPYVGYLAGHITRSSSFTNVYVNRCTIDGQNTIEGNTDNYGYYGYAQYDSLGGEYGKGNSYKFTLDSQAAYSYFNDNYGSKDLASKTLVVRNTKEVDDQDSTVAPNGDHIRVTEETFGKAVTNSGITYKLEGSAGPTSLSNSSLSTIGFSTPEYREENRTYNAYYTKNGESTRLTPSKQPVYSDISIIETNVGQKDKYGNEVGMTAYYMFNDMEEAWYYGESYNRNATEADKANYNLTVSFADIPISAFTIRNPPTLKSPFIAYLYVDNRNPISVTVTVSAAPESNRLGWYLSGGTISFRTATFSIPDVGYGTHSIAIYAPFRWTTADGKATHYFYQTEFGTLDTNNQTITLSSTSMDFKGATGSTTNITYPRTLAWSEDSATNDYNLKEPSFPAFSFPKDDPPAYIDPRSFEAPVTFIKVKEDGSEDLDYPGITDQNPIRFNDFHWESGRWWIESTFHIPIQGGTESIEFVADSPQLVDSGYSYKNIDVVGGGVDFFYNDRYVKISVIRIPSEKTAGERIGVPPEKGKKFYAPTHCPGSIVLFLKNTFNALDNRNDEMGSISFSYVGGTLGSILTNVTPSFIRGDSFENLSSAGQNPTTSNGTITQTINVTLTEEDVKKVAYCAIDKDKKVLGRYTVDGAGNVKTTMSNEEQLAIDTYVLVLGTQSNNGNKAWVTKVDFSYTAEVGYGGTFGSVEYRSAAETVTQTIFNFYFEVNKGANYRFSVQYVSGETPTYHLFVYAEAAITVQYYLYDTNYSLMINEVAAAGSKGTYTIEASNRTSWGDTPPFV